MRPGPLRAGPLSITADTGSAGSVLLMAQALLPCALFAHGGPSAHVTLDLRGGTDAAKAPPVAYLESVLLPTLRRALGIDVSVEHVHRGFYPQGSGRLVLRVAPLPPGAALPAFDLTDRGPIVDLSIRAFVAGLVPRAAGSAMVRAARAVLRREKPEAMGLGPGVSPDDRGVQEVGPDAAFGSGSGVAAAARSQTGCLLCAARPGERDRDEEVGDEVGDELAWALRAGGCCDEWLQVWADACMNDLNEINECMGESNDTCEGP